MTHPNNIDVKPGQPQQYEEFRSEETPNDTQPENGGPQAGPVRPPSDAKLPPECLDSKDEAERQANEPHEE